MTSKAGRVWGSCRPLFAQLLGVRPEPAAQIGRRALVGATVAAAMFLGVLLAPYVLPHADLVQSGWSIRCGADGFWK